jgi:predicted N-acetyltransferase YhbS
MSSLDITIEPQRAADGEAVERLQARAFGPGRFARTAFRIREQARDAESLAFVARVGSLLVGAVQLTPIHVGDQKAFMLGPLVVDPAFEGKGIGRALLERSAIAARAVRRNLILLVGDEAYYARHGYRRVPAGRIRLPGPVDPLRLLAFGLEPGALDAASGEVRGG